MGNRFLNIFYRIFLIAIIKLAVISICIAQENETPPVSGIYRNLSYNIDGAGGSNRLMPELIIYPNGYYTWGQEKGLWSAHGSKLRFSKRLSWGDATVNTDNGQLLFEFIKNGKRYVVTMYRSGDILNNNNNSSSGNTSNILKTPHYGRVDVIGKLVLPKNFSGFIPSMVWVDTKGQDPDKLVWVDKDHNFRANNVRWDAIYDIYWESYTGGRGEKFFQIDMHKISNPKTVQITVPEN